MQLYGPRHLRPATILRPTGPLRSGAAIRGPSGHPALPLLWQYPRGRPIGCTASGAAIRSHTAGYTHPRPAVILRPTGPTLSSSLGAAICAPCTSIRVMPSLEGADRECSIWGLSAGYIRPQGTQHCTSNPCIKVSSASHKLLKGQTHHPAV